MQSAPPATQIDLNISLGSSSAIVLVGLVNSRVSQLDTDENSSGGSMIETLKKREATPKIQDRRWL